MDEREAKQMIAETWRQMFWAALGKVLLFRAASWTLSLFVWSVVLLVVSNAAAKLIMVVLFVLQGGS
jgi:hypothetical protein